MLIETIYQGGKVKVQAMGLHLPLENSWNQSRIRKLFVMSYLDLEPSKSVEILIKMG